jgi:hypothetical protein
MLSYGVNATDTDRITSSVGRVLVEQGVPLRLVGVQVSNMKPDDSVVEAQVAQKAAEARTAAIKTLTDFLDQDPTGTRKMMYRMQVLQELTRTANANGHNTIFLTDLGGPNAGILLLPAGHQWRMAELAAHRRCSRKRLWSIPSWLPCEQVGFCRILPRCLCWCSP